MEPKEKMKTKVVNEELELGTNVGLRKNTKRFQRSLNGHICI